MGTLGYTSSDYWGVGVNHQFIYTCRINETTLASSSVPTLAQYACTRIQARQMAERPHANISQLLIVWKIWLKLNKYNFIAGILLKKNHLHYAFSSYGPLFMKIHHLKLCPLSKSNTFDQNFINYAPAMTMAGALSVTPVRTY